MIIKPESIWSATQHEITLSTLRWWEHPWATHHWGPMWCHSWCVHDFQGNKNENTQGWLLLTTHSWEFKDILSEQKMQLFCRLLHASLLSHICTRPHLLLSHIVRSASATQEYPHYENCGAWLYGHPDMGAYISSVPAHDFSVCIAFTASFYH